jgi:hypothetical protein
MEKKEGPAWWGEPNRPVGRRKEIRVLLLSWDFATAVPLTEKSPPFLEKVTRAGD